MKNPPILLIEARVSDWFVADVERQISISIDRDPSGRVDAATRRRLIEGLREFGTNRTDGRRRAICAIGSRGVSIRRLRLPASVKGEDELRRLLLFQIEKEFPLPPDELAWARIRPDSIIASKSTPSTETPEGGEHVVAAVRRGTVDECADILSESGLIPIITLAAALRGSVCNPTETDYSILELGHRESELVCFEHNLPVFVRVLPFGFKDCEEAVDDPIQDDVGEGFFEPVSAETVMARLTRAMSSLPDLVRNRTLFVIGSESGARLQEATSFIAAAAGVSGSGLPIHWGSENPETPATRGLRGLGNGLEMVPPLVFETESRVDERRGHAGAGRFSRGSWAAAFLLLMLMSFLLRYSGPVFRGPALARNMERIESQAGALTRMDGELGFLQFIATNRPPFVEVLSNLANAVPRGTRIEVLSMDRRGDFSMRGTVVNPDQAIAFRAKLIETELFSSVIVEEQGPGADNKELQVRIHARWR